MSDLLGWWLAVEVVGVIALPMTAALFARLPDRGWGLARPLGLLMLGWLVWFPLSLVHALPYSRGWIAGTLVALALGNAALLRLPHIRGALRGLVTREWRYLLACEAVFTGGFALMAWLRSFTPAVVDTEKFMDVAFLSAIWRAPHLPAPDPWLAGQPINYYYFGHFLMATLAKLLGTQPAVAFNVAVALIFALTAVAIFTLTSNIVALLRAHPGRTLGRAAPFGLAAVVLALVLGNLQGARIWWDQAVAQAKQLSALHGNPWAWWTHPALWVQYDWWSPSRVFSLEPSPPIQGNITEFPAFSFILSDLHAHVLALPFATLALGVALNLLLGRGAGLRAFGDRGQGVLALGLSALALGALYAINGWDLPTYLGIALLALAAQQWMAHDRHWSMLFALDLASAAIMLAALAVLFFVPFYRGFTSPAQGIGLVPSQARSPVGDEVAMFGLPIFLVGSLLVVRLASWARDLLSPGEEQAGGGPAVAPAALVGALAALLLLWTLATSGSTGWTLAWSLLLLAGCAALALRQLAADVGASKELEAQRRGEVFLWCLAGAAVGLVGLSEVVYLRDVFDGGNLFRMNTVFKFYYQAWLLLAIAGGAALSQVVRLARAGLRPLLERGASDHAAGWAVRDGEEELTIEETGTPAPSAVALATARSASGGSPQPTVRGRSGVPPADVPEPARDTGPGSPRTREPRLATGISPIRPGALRWWGAGGTLLWGAALLGLVAVALVYPVQAVAARTDNFSLPRSLDGTAFMNTDAMNLGDAAAIAWLNQPGNVAGDPVIVEAVDAQGGDYTHFSRISAFTGLPTVIGWVGHEWQWRAIWAVEPQHAGELQRRQTDVNQIYTSGDPTVVRGLLARYDVRYVYVGAAERQRYPGVSMDRFSTFLRVVYRKDGVTIYEVV